MYLELKRSPQDTKLYALEGVGKVRIEGRFATRATAEVSADRWDFDRRGLRGPLRATDAAGEMTGKYWPLLYGGGTLTWRRHELAVRRASTGPERYALADGDRELALFDARGWGKEPVRISLEGLEDVEPALLLFAAWVVRVLPPGGS